MISNLFNLLFFNPIYNGLVFLIATFSWIDMGFAIIIITLIVKLISLPLTKKTIRLQIIQKKIEPQLKKIKEEYKDDKEKQALKTMEVYKENKLNPLSGILVMFIQIPIIFALYFVFLKGGLPEVNFDILYFFVDAPKEIHTLFLGLVDVTEKSLLFAFLAGITQFIQINLVLPSDPLKKKKNQSFKEDLARSLQLQMKFVMPILIVFIAYSLPSAIALYWITSNVFMIFQEIFVKRKMEKNEKLKTLEN